MSPVFDDLIGQRRVEGHLRKAVDAGAVAHAYLFLGPVGAGRKTAARGLACALLCDAGGCGTCEACRRVRNGTHPDFHVLRPGGVAGYVIDQIREVTRDINLKPVEGAWKVYVLEDAGRLQGAPANAFLKTLEEPPAGVVVVLLADDYEDVLPTIASRCQVVRFAAIPESVALGLVVERTGASTAEAREALAATGGIALRAVEFLRSAHRQSGRRTVLGTLKRLSVMDGHDVLQAAKELLLQVRAPAEDLKALQAQETEDVREFLSKGAIAEVEKRHKRELTAREREGVTELLDVTESWLRDCLVMAQGIDELIVNDDVTDATVAVALRVSPAAIVRAFESVRTARTRIAYNVNPQLAIEVMLFDIQEVLRCPQSWE